MHVLGPRWKRNWLAVQTPCTASPRVRARARTRRPRVSARLERAVREPCTPVGHTHLAHTPCTHVAPCTHALDPRWKRSWLAVQTPCTASPRVGACARTRPTKVALTGGVDRSYLLVVRHAQGRARARKLEASCHLR
ncbi:hypothetical protein RI054_41g148260 [Pseudoscourfieldia marina]